jgi:signal transduction histidine kinase
MWKTMRLSLGGGCYPDREAFCPDMQPYAPERRHLERQVTYARVVFLVLALTALFLDQTQPLRPLLPTFLFAYLAFAVGLLWLQQSVRHHDWQVPVAVDLGALALVLALTPSIVPFWLLFLFVAWAAGARWGLQRSIELAGGVTLAVLLHAAYYARLDWSQLISWIALLTGTSTAGVGLSFLGDRYRRQAIQHALLARLIDMLKVEQGTAESIRLVLAELTSAFQCEKALLAFRDPDLERMFLWTVAADQQERITPASRPQSEADQFLLGRPEALVCWNSIETSRRGFGWDRRTGRRLVELPLIPQEARRELAIRSFMSVPMDFGGHSSARIILCNGRRRWWHQDLHWLDRVVCHLGHPLHNIFLLRHMRARAIESERSRISRDIHDGILQTLLSVDMQLGVLYRKALRQPDEAATGLESLQQTVRSETAELRRMVTDMRPVAVESADLVELMQGFAERFRNESGLALDLLLDVDDLQAPDRVCRDLFQIYREALHNVKKHAHASHVVVKLWQNDTQVTLMIDDNGQGFSFAGRYMGEDLERLRLGPISIKERARSVGGLLTVESTPGHGARLTVEVPLS